RSVMDESMPATLGAAMATEPLWLRAWLAVLVSVYIAALLFIVRREAGSWRVRAEPIAILASFLGSAVLMNAIYAQVGYVRLLGLAHLVFWTPVFVWIVYRRRAIGTGSLFRKYLHAYLLIAGVSLLIDAIDVVRYFVGDGDLLHRWG
ncbi:MAG: hypothetical protein WEF50_09510, partial [Myxococcota bacterium]